MDKLVIPVNGKKGRCFYDGEERIVQLVSVWHTVAGVAPGQVNWHIMMPLSGGGSPFH